MGHPFCPWCRHGVTTWIMFPTLCCLAGKIVRGVNFSGTQLHLITTLNRLRPNLPVPVWQNVDLAERTKNLFSYTSLTVNKYWSHSDIALCISLLSDDLIKPSLVSLGSEGWLIATYTLRLVRRWLGYYPSKPFRWTFHHHSLQDFLCQICYARPTIRIDDVLFPFRGFAAAALTPARVYPSEIFHAVGVVEVKKAFLTATCRVSWYQLPCLLLERSS